VNDRHYAQQNIQIHTVDPGRRVVIPFSAIGSARGGQYLIGMRQLVTEQRGTEVLTFPNDAFLIIDPQHRSDPQGRLLIDLRPWERRSLQALFAIPENAVPGAVAELVIEQTSLGQDQGGSTGAIGVRVYVAD
jgi:hypothetical protein